MKIEMLKDRTPVVGVEKIQLAARFDVRDFSPCGKDRGDGPRDPFYYPALSIVDLPKVIGPVELTEVEDLRPGDSCRLGNLRVTRC